MAAKKILKLKGKNIFFTQNSGETFRKSKGEGEGKINKLQRRN
jgi:hypothetical protein